jgi:peptidoglycan/LPS O-acetylase OafA/YrhL
MRQSEKMKQNRIRSLDGLRGFLSLIVIAIHIWIYLTAAKFIPQSLDYLGIFSIHLFFVISGFLVHKTYSERIHEARPKTTFFIRRFFRLIPLWWLLLWVLAYFRHLEFKVVIANMFYYFGFVLYDSQYFPVVVAWTLHVEECFYSLFPFLFFSLRKEKILHWIVITSVISSLWIIFAGPSGVPTENFYINRSAVLNFQYFPLGIALSHIYSQKNWWNLIETRFPRLLDVITLLSFLFVTTAPAFPYKVSLLIVVMATLTQSTLFSRFLNLSILRWLGVRCYGLYLLHEYCKELTHATLQSYWQGYNDLMLEVRFIVLTVAVVLVTSFAAWVSYKFLELPFMRLGEKLIRGMKTQ